MTGNLLFVIRSLEISGSAMQLCLLARKLLGSPFRPRILCLEMEGELAESTREAGVPVDCLNVGDPLSWGTCYRAKRYCAQHGIDLVHTFLGGMDSAFVRGARSGGARAIIQSRREIPEEVSSKDLKQRQVSQQRTDLVICNSNAAREFTCEVEEWPKEQVKVIPNGFPEEAIPDQPLLIGRPKGKRYLWSCQFQENEKVLACIADFVPSKNHVGLMDALRILLFEQLLIRVVFLGDGPLFGEVERYAGDRNLFRAVVFLGKRKERLKMLAECDALILPSLRESFPNALLEAQALGVPVTAARVGGIPELIVDGETGRLFDPKKPQEMAEAIRETLYQREVVLERARRGQQRVREEFTATRMVERHLKVYGDLLG